MAQNIYDDERFFGAYAGLARSVHGHAGAPEFATVRTLLPSLLGASVVDLGCGYGWFARFARDQGAATVVAVDLSERMLARAAELTGDEPRIRYRRQDLDRLDLAGERFDLAYSSLTLHYLADLGGLLAAVCGALVPGGRFVFTAEHPIYTAPRRPGFVDDSDGGRRWPVDGYLDEGERVTDWLAPGVVKHHRTLGTYVAALRTAGFELDDLIEWGPRAEQVAEHPEWAGDRERPMLFIAAATRPPRPGR